MPLHPRHQEKRRTNYALAIILFGLVSLFFSLTIIKMKQSSYSSETNKTPITNEQKIEETTIK